MLYKKKKEKRKENKNQLNFGRCRPIDVRLLSKIENIHRWRVREKKCDGGKTTKRKKEETIKKCAFKQIPVRKCSVFQMIFFFISLLFLFCFIWWPIERAFQISLKRLCSDTHVYILLYTSTHYNIQQNPAKRQESGPLLPVSKHWTSSRHYLHV